jgi:hypothetical protein
MTINISDLQTLLAWIRGENIFFNKPNVWDWLLINISFSEEETYELNNGDFEKIMLDVYDIVLKIESSKISENLDNPILKNLNLDTDMIQKEIEKMDNLKQIVDNLFISSSFKSNKLNKIKLDILRNELKNKIKLEDYESCITLSKDIKELENYFSKA